MEKSYDEQVLILKENKEKHESRTKAIKRILFFPLRIIPKKVRTYISLHWTESNKITIASEICGIIGLIFSIAIFFYAQRISNQQIEIDKVNRKIELNNLIDNNSLLKILLIRNYFDNKQSIYKDVLNYTINAEILLYQNIILNTFNTSENPDYFTIYQEEQAKSYFNKFHNSSKDEQELIYKLDGTIDILSNSILKKDTIFINKISLIRNDIKSISGKYNTNIINMNIHLSSILKKDNNIKTNYTEISNSIIKKIKKDDYINIRVSYYREIIKLFDYTLNYILLSENLVATDM